MPIIFENRLGNGETDRKLRKIYHIHNILWTIYYAIFFAAVGFGAAIIAAARGGFIFAVLVAAATVVVLVLFLRRRIRQWRRR